MPKILEIRGYKFYIYTDDHLPLHVHVLKGGSEVKINLAPEIEIVHNYDFKSQELRQILTITSENYEYLIERWHEIQG